MMNESHEEEQLASDLRDALGIGESLDLKNRLQESIEDSYEILDEIGRGAYCIVFKARDKRRNRMVAIKSPAPGESKGKRIALFDEAKAMASVVHPNVVQIFEASEDKDPPFLVMEYVDGLPITQACEELDLEHKVRLFAQVLKGVCALHAKGVVHRDLKPSNILADRSGSVKLLDLGIAKEAQYAPDQPFFLKDACGTPSYIAPEQSLGNPPKPHMDVFALGVIFYEILTLERPFQGQTAKEVLKAVRESAPQLPRALNPKIPGPLQAICLTALEKSPEDRYQTARFFLLDLERYLQGESITANPKILVNILEHGVQKHLDDLSRWLKNHMLSLREHDYFSRKYNRLLQREETWILDSRNISFSQAILHLGAWTCFVSVLLMLCFSWERLSKTMRISFPLGVFLILSGFGMALWFRRTRRVALVMLAAAALIWPIFVGITLTSMNWFDVSLQTFEKGQDPHLFSGFLGNTQLLIAAGAWVGLSLVFWIKTRTAAFSLIFGFSLLLFSTALFSFMGLKQMLEQGQYDKVAALYLAPGILTLCLALYLDLKKRIARLAAPLYFLCVLVLLMAFTGIAIFGPTTHWLGLDAMIKAEADRVPYSLMLNGALYLILGFLADASQTSRHLRTIASVLFWLAPTHILGPVAHFSMQEKWSWVLLPVDWTLSELLLPLGALCFVFISVPKQMKSFFFSGLFYAAFSVVWLTNHHFMDVFAWPLCLALLGLILLILSWRWPGLMSGKRKNP